MSTNAHIYVLFAVVTKVYEANELVSAKKNPDGTTSTETRSLGWSVATMIDGVPFAFNFGKEKPEFVVGDKLRITLSKEG